MSTTKIFLTQFSATKKNGGFLGFWGDFLQNDIFPCKVGSFTSYKWKVITYNPYRWPEIHG